MQNGREMGKTRQDFVALGLYCFSFPHSSAALTLRALSRTRQFWPRNDHLKDYFLFIIVTIISRCGESLRFEPGLRRSVPGKLGYHLSVRPSGGIFHISPRLHRSPRRVEPTQSGPGSAPRTRAERRPQHRSSGGWEPGCWGYGAALALTRFIPEVFFQPRG